MKTGRTSAPLSHKSLSSEPSKDQVEGVKAAAGSPGLDQEEAEPTADLDPGNPAQ